MKITKLFVLQQPVSHAVRLAAFRMRFLRHLRWFLFLLLSGFLTASGGFAQSQFQTAIGGAGLDIGFSIVQTSCGGYAISGATDFFGAGYEDFYIVKADGSGVIEWSRTVGGTDIEWASSIIQTTDGGFAVAGDTDSFGAGWGDFYVVKLDSNGIVQWTRTVGGELDEWAYSIVQTTDGGYAVAGYTDSFGAGGGDFYIVKLDAAGILQWTRTVGGTELDEATSIIQTTDGGFAITGYTYSFGAGATDIYVVKLDSNGTLLWTRTIGGIEWEDAYTIIQTSDGGFAIAGSTDSFGAGGGDTYIVKLDAGGMLQWSRTIGGIGHDSGFGIVQTTDGGIAISGYTESFGAGFYDFYIVKLDANGTLQWTRTVGGLEDDMGLGIVQTTDGGFAISGATLSFGAGDYDMFIVKLDGSGNTCANQGTGGTSGSGGVSNITGGAVGIGGTSGAGGISGSGGAAEIICILTSVQELTTENEPRVYIYPNPFSETAILRIANLPSTQTDNLELRIYDLLGKQIHATLLRQADSFIIRSNNMPAGMYLYHVLLNGERIANGKLLRQD